MAIITKASMHSPSHPGEILRVMYLEPMKVSITEAAEALGVTRKHVSAIVNGRSPITADMALRLAAVFTTEAEFWLNMQTQRDLWEVNQRAPPKVKPLRIAA
ncbi:MAG: HigA family addiction module antitoxin [Gammaproteobacteria bacterium]